MSKEQEVVESYRKKYEGNDAKYAPTIAEKRSYRFLEDQRRYLRFLISFKSKPIPSSGSSRKASMKS
jgi:hypothetical protein